MLGERVKKLMSYYDSIVEGSPLTIAIVGYECGNTGSIANMLRYRSKRKGDARNPELQSASGIILPGGEL